MHNLPQVTSLERLLAPAKRKVKRYFGGINDGAYFSADTGEVWDDPSTDVGLGEALWCSKAGTGMHAELEYACNYASSLRKQH